MSLRTSRALRPEDHDKIRESGVMTGEILDALRPLIKPGITTMEIEDSALMEVRARGAKASFRGYRGFPFATCISVNDDFVHGYPSDRVLKSGDIVTVDMGVLWKGYHSDSAYTFPVGDLSPKVISFLDSVWESLYASIAEAKPGSRAGEDVGRACEEVVLSDGYQVSHELMGHGIGTTLHKEPHIPNYRTRVPSMNAKLQKDEAIAIEIMASMGDPSTFQKRDGWTLCTKDGSLTAHYEHTLFVKENPEILTSSPLWERPPSELSCA